MGTPTPQPVEIAGFAPDLPDFNNPMSPNALNVIPRSSKSYGPVGSMKIYSQSALTARCQGGAGYLDKSGNIYLFAGDRTKLYKYDGAAATWGNISGASGPFATPTNGRWNFEYFNNLIAATNFSDGIQAYTMGVSATFGLLAAAAPKARYMAVLRGAFLMVGNTHDATDGDRPQRLWWPAVGDPTNWPVPGTTAAAQVMSSFVDVTGSQGWLQGLVGGLANADGAAFFEHAVHRVTFSGPPDIFDVSPAQGVKGCPAPGSIIQVGSIVYYLAEDGFASFDGSTSKPIGVDLVDKFFIGDVDSANYARMVGASDPTNKIVFWIYPRKNNTGGLPNRLLAYHWGFEKWAAIDISAEYAVRLMTVGYTLDQLYTVLGYTIDGLPAPLDDRIWTGGLITLGLFDSAHKLNYLNGPALQATLDSGERQYFPGKRTYVDAARPWVQGSSVTPSVLVGSRDRLNDPVQWGPASVQNAFGTCPQRKTGRYVRTRLVIPAADTWEHALGMELDIQSRGMR